MSDKQDRLFASMPRHFDQVSISSKNLKECLPELYYLPELLGKSAEGVAAVELPAWSRQNEQTFVYIHRMVLESEHVGQHLNKWIDLHFGSRLLGKKAVESSNVY